MARWMALGLARHLTPAVAIDRDELCSADRDCIGSCKSSDELERHFERPVRGVNGMPPAVID